MSHKKLVILPFSGLLFHYIVYILVSLKGNLLPFVSEFNAVVQVNCGLDMT